MIWKASEWQSPSGKWYINDVSHIPKPHNSANPMHPLNIMGIETFEAFAEWLKKEFNANINGVTKNMVHFNFNTLTEARKYKNYINAQARKVNYTIGE